MVITEYRCDACDEKCNAEDVTIIAAFPRRKYEYARDMLGVKLCGFAHIAFEETHFCSRCLQRLLNFTNIIEE